MGRGRYFGTTPVIVFLLRLVHQLIELLLRETHCGPTTVVACCLRSLWSWALGTDLTLPYRNWRFGGWWSVYMLELVDQLIDSKPTNFRLFSCCSWLWRSYTGCSWWLTQLVNIFLFFPLLVKQDDPTLLTWLIVLMEQHFLLGFFLVNIVWLYSPYTWLVSLLLLNHCGTWIYRSLQV